MVAKKRGLGRGLDALLNTAAQQQGGDHPGLADATQAASPGEAGADQLRRLPVEWLQPGRYQPRKDMSPDALAELAASIRTQGIIQPITVRPLSAQRFEIIAGERRWRAAQQAELDQVPVLIKDIPDESAVAIALIENIQREDLNALEEAEALQRLLEEFEYTHQQVAEAVGKSRTAVTNLLRLNNLHPDVKPLLEHGDIDMGHARALLSLEGELQAETARQIAAKGLSVRETENLVKKLLEPKQPRVTPPVDPDVVALERDLSENLGAPVAIKSGSKGKGQLVISYASHEQLDAILAKIQ